MPFDDKTRNRLARFVTDARELITSEFAEQLQRVFGISVTGEITDIVDLKDLDEQQRGLAELLRERIEYLKTSSASEENPTAAAIDRLTREQAFTILNRLAAIRMAEKREFIVESVANGYQSKGFQVYCQVAGSSLGDIYNRYRQYMFCLFDELALDLGALFDRRSPTSLLFPRESALVKLFELINAYDIDVLWVEDETIGWIYQYYNDGAERQRMRERSAAPRDSRELAVRNQFFTPRYVVEFLVDNTLGRIWYEMTHGDTTLKNRCQYLALHPNEVFLDPGQAPAPEQESVGLSQKRLLELPGYVPHRPLKDPREIRLLDPACGSMHFGIYAFDLFEVIYEEAWQLSQKGELKVTSLLAPLHETYASREALLRDIPRLIIENNIHGIDIDSRAVQIAGLSLWLRAQKTWKERELPLHERPQITRSQIVCAEAMPGNSEYLREFCQTLHPPILGQFLEKIFARMKLAGEAGSLLKIEQDIAELVREAKVQWQKGPVAEQVLLFEDLAKPTQESFHFDQTGVTDEQFWETAERKIYETLSTYAERADARYSRRLFADDAARGFAFIDLCRKRYDAVVMNPPFGRAPEQVAWMIPDDAASNLYPAFVLRGAALSTGFVGAITDRTFVVQQSFGRFRERLTSDLGLIALVDLGWGILDDADVQVAVYFIRCVSEPIHLFSALNNESGDISNRLRETVTNCEWTALSSEVIHQLPNSAFAHTLPTVYVTHLGVQTALKNFGTLPRGLGSNDAHRTYRAWYEVAVENIGDGDRYRSLSNGGPCSPFFRDDAGIAEWIRSDGKLLVEEGYSEVDKAYDQKGYAHYFSAGLSFPKQALIFNVAALSVDSIPTREGKAIIPSRSQDRLPLLAYLNSKYARFFVEATNGLHKQSGPVGMTPVPAFSEAARTQLGNLALRAWQLIAQTYTFDEASRFFVRPAGLKEVPQIYPAIKEILEKIDAIVFQEVGVEPNDREKISALNSSQPAPFVSSPADILSYGIGCAFGRWDIRLITSENLIDRFTDPFAALPVCPPGLLQGEPGLPLTKEDAMTRDALREYPLEVSWNGILVDDPGHALDIELNVQQALETVFGNEAEDIEQKTCKLLGCRSLRDYFRKSGGFFADHLKRYSKCRRQAPIYWPLSTRSGSYTVWLYHLRLNSQTLHACLADFLDPKLKNISDQIRNIRQSNESQTKLGELLEREDELNEMRIEIERLIKLPFEPNLDDGVMITASPLWKLFRLSKWQKDLKACWQELERGDYDWAHLAHSIWPDRVRQKCKTDRSIAIAHGLEDLCTVEETRAQSKKTRQKEATLVEEDNF
jgi:hypothetical protein